MYNIGKVSVAEKHVLIRSLKNQEVIADTCTVAVSYFDRLRGLIGRKKFVPGQGMYFPRCNNIHMWFMRITIDVVFVRSVEGKWLVSSVFASVRPWRFFPVLDLRASETLELPAGTIGRHAIAPGDEICIS